MAIVYQHRRNDTNEIFYIGIGTRKERARSRFGRNTYWKNIANKVGYTIEILDINLSWEEACEREKDLIKKYGRKDLGLGTLVNMTDGGEGLLNKIFTDSTKEKLRKINLGKKMSQDTKEKLRKINLGKKMPLESIERTRQARLGTKHSIESIEKNRQSNLGKKRTSESIERIRQKNIGKKRTEETKEKIRIKAIGRILTEDTKVKLRKPKSEQAKENMRLAWIKRKENINV